jgi:hypothetical protein
MENNKLMLYGVLAIVLFSVIYSLVKLKISSNWDSTNGEILQSEIKTVYRSSLQQGAGGDRTIDYQLEIRYRYQVNNKEYIGDQVAAGLPNIAGSKADGDAFIKDHSIGKTVRVFYNPKSPAEAALITGKSIPTAGYILLFLMAAIVGLVIFMGIKFIS